MTTRTTTTESQLLTVTEAAQYLYGRSDKAARAKLIRLADRGVLGCARIGERRDRQFARAALDDLLASAATPEF